jgi:hypothetical protein
MAVLIRLIFPAMPALASANHRPLKLLPISRAASGIVAYQIWFMHKYRKIPVKKTMLVTCITLIGNYCVREIFSDPKPCFVC